MIQKSNQDALRSLADILSRSVAFDLQSLDDKEKTVLNVASVCTPCRMLFRRVAQSLNRSKF